MRAQPFGVFGVIFLVATLASGHEEPPQTDERFVLKMSGLGATFVDLEDTTAPPGSELRVSLHMGEGFYDWLRASFEGRAKGRHGAIVAGDHYFDVTWQRPFESASLSGIEFPGLDGHATDSAKLNLRLSGDIHSPEPASGQLPTVPDCNGCWLSGAFRLDLEGLPTDEITHVDPLNVTITPAGPRASSLVFHVSAEGAKPFYEWQEASSPPKDAALHYVNGLNEVAITLRFAELRLLELTPLSNSNPPQVRVAAWPEKVSLEGG
jgi:hypothetical protein